jgi:hypothetical protein
MFSPILATKVSRTVDIVTPFSCSAFNSSMLLIFFAAATPINCLPNPKKPSSRATKSASQLISIIVAWPWWTTVRITPSAAIRPAFLAAFAWPDLRIFSIANSTSPSVSTSAFLQSSMPAPVRSRSSFTSAAVTAIICKKMYWGTNYGSDCCTGKRTSRAHRRWHAWL